MIIAKRDRHHIRQTASGSVLVGESGANGPTFPPADFHFGPAPDEVVIGPVGDIYTYTVVHGSNAPSYALAMVDFPQNVRVFGRMVGDTSRLQIGARVSVVPFLLPDEKDDYAFSLEEVAE